MRRLSTSAGTTNFDRRSKRRQAFANYANVALNWPYNHEAADWHCGRWARIHKSDYTAKLTEFVNTRRVRRAILVGAWLGIKRTH
jgi:hypothetical protein